MGRCHPLRERMASKDEGIKKMSGKKRSRIRARGSDRDTSR